jgi:hypothetical protein
MQPSSLLPGSRSEIDTYYNQSVVGYGTLPVIIFQERKGSDGGVVA